MQISEVRISIIFEDDTDKRRHYNLVLVLFPYCFPTLGSGHWDTMSFDACNLS